MLTRCQGDHGAAVRRDRAAGRSRRAWRGRQRSGRGGRGRGPGGAGRGGRRRRPGAVAARLQRRGAPALVGAAGGQRPLADRGAARGGARRVPSRLELSWRLRARGVWGPVCAALPHARRRQRQLLVRIRIRDGAHGAHVDGARLHAGVAAAHMAEPHAGGRRPRGDCVGGGCDAPAHLLPHDGPRGPEHVGAAAAVPGAALPRPRSRRRSRWARGERRSAPRPPPGAMPLRAPNDLDQRILYPGPAQRQPGAPLPPPRRRGCGAERRASPSPRSTGISARRRCGTTSTAAARARTRPSTSSRARGEASSNSRCATKSLLRRAGPRPAEPRRPHASPAAGPTLARAAHSTFQVPLPQKYTRTEPG